MSQAIELRALDLFKIRETLREIVKLRGQRRFSEADAVRQSLLALDSGMRIILRAEKATLWHYPDPPFSGHFHYVNYPEFIANSNER